MLCTMYFHEMRVDHKCMLRTLSLSRNLQQHRWFRTWMGSTDVWTGWHPWRLARRQSDTLLVPNVSNRSRASGARGMELSRGATNLEQDRVRAGFTHFVSCRDDATLQIAAESLGDFPDGLGRDVLITGPPKCGKTSMLFHCASKYAENGMHVIMLLRRAKVESHPPCLPPLSMIDDECYNRVHIKYVNHLDNLRKFLSCAHLCKINASAILLDDLSSYIYDDLQESRMRSYESCLARVLAELKEAADAVARRTGAPCGLVVTDRGNDEGPSHRYVYERWLPLVLCSSPQGNGCYNLSQIARQEVPTHHGAVQYRIDDERFALEKILAAPARTTPTKRCWNAS